MSTAEARTKAEQAILEGFAGIAAALPGGPAVSAARRQAIDDFARTGLPHRRLEDWKYTDLRVALKEALPPARGASSGLAPAALEAALGPLAQIAADRIVVVDGTFDRQASQLPDRAGVDVLPLGEALKSLPDLVGERLTAREPAADPLLALNTAFMTDGTVVRVRAGAKLARPLMVVMVRAAAEPSVTTTRTVVSVCAEAEATLIEAFVTVAGARPGQTNHATDVVVGEAARFSHVACALATGETRLASTSVRLSDCAHYRGFQFTRSPLLARNQSWISFDGEGSKLDLSGAFLARGGEHVDTSLVIDHAKPGCESRELFKGVLDGRARGVFQGRIIVRPDAQKTDGKQMAQALMLSPDAEFDSKPELEIYADDVVCGHGSTSAELDPDHLFYCRARGIPPNEARALLVEAFVGEAIDKVESAEMADALRTLAGEWLAGAGQG